MKTNSIIKTYQSLLNPIETQRAMALFQRYFIDNLESNLNIHEIRGPLFEPFNSNSEAFNFLNSRNINFDSAKNPELFYLLNRFDLFLRNSLVLLDIKNNNGIFMHQRYINRDNEINNHQSIEENKILIEMNIENIEDSATKLLDLARKIYKIFVQTVFELSQQFPVLKQRFSRLVEVDAKPYFKNRQISSQTSVFNTVLEKNPTALIYNYNHDAFDSLTFYLQEKYLVIGKYLDRSKQNLILFEGFIRIDYNRQAPKNDNEIIEKNLQNKYLLNERFNSINLTINLDNLLTIALQKAHNIELQSGLKTEPIKELFTNYGIKQI